MSKLYFADADLLTEQIRRKRELLNRATGHKRHEINRQLLCLYEMRRDCIITARHLCNYYTDDGRKHYVKRVKRNAP